MKVQLTLREHIPAEKKLIDHINALGFRSGEAKRLLMVGFAAEKIGISDELEPPAPEVKKPPQVDNISLDNLAG